MFSVIIPVYFNRPSLPELLLQLGSVSASLTDPLEVVFVVDGSPDESAKFLAENLSSCSFQSQLLILSRNFGAFQAVRSGLEAGHGANFAVIAADLQEPPDLLLRFHTELKSGTYDVVVGTRIGRGDPLLSRAASWLFWVLYRTLVQPEVPKGGIDVFGCTRQFRDELICMAERNSTLVGLLVWLGFRRGEVVYERLPRRHGRSAWSLRRKVRYLLDSTFAFSELPLRMLTAAGLVGLGVAAIQGVVVVVARLTGGIAVPGYAATMTVVTFFGGLNALGLGIVGEYLWRTLAQARNRDQFIIEAVYEAQPDALPGEDSLNVHPDTPHDAGVEK